MMLIHLMSFLRSFAPADAPPCLPTDDGPDSARQAASGGGARKLPGVLLFRH